LVDVTIVGTGRIGTVLGRRFSEAGMAVKMASRNAERTDVAGLPVRPVAEALPGADVVVLAIPGAAVPQFLQSHDLAGVPLVDASNSMGGPAMHHAADADGLLYFRAFNTVGVENFAAPTFDGIAADLFYSGPQSHRDLVGALIRAVGMRPVWVGEGVAAADLLDGLTRLWFTLALTQGRGRHLAFRMLP
jgi:hypothetical protein